MEGKHTPGPWEVTANPSGHPYQIYAPRGINMQAITRWGAISMPSSDEGKANARLIAAAPELLDALTYARRFLNPTDHDTTFVDSAISKATEAA